MPGCTWRAASSPRWTPTDRRSTRPCHDLEGAWLLPGFLDLHMHGGGGHDVAASREAMEAAVAFHRRHGTTATLVSLMTAPVDELCEQLSWAAELARRGPGPRGHVLGAHLEGPFLSPRRAGAQDPAHMLAPDRRGAGPVGARRRRRPAGDDHRARAPRGGGPDRAAAPGGRDRGRGALRRRLRGGRRRDPRRRHTTPRISSTRCRRCTIARRAWWARRWRPTSRVSSSTTAATSIPPWWGSSRAPSPARCS